ncbi:MAG: RND family transporter [Pirellulales bacterium]
MTKPFFARNYFVILLLVVFLAPFITRGARMAIEGNNNDIKDWLPPDYPESTRLKWFQRHFLGEQFILVSWEGCTLGDTTKLDLLAHKLVPRDDQAQSSDRARLFHTVVTGPETLDKMTAPPLSLDYPEAIRRLEGALIGPDLTGEGDAGRTTCLVVTLSEEGKKSNINKRRALEEIEAAAAECAIPAEALQMGGPPVDNVAIDVEGARTLTRLAGLSGIVGFVLAYWCFRSIRLTLMVFSVGVLSAGISLAMVYYFGLAERLATGLETARFGTVDAILMSMPAVVYVLGMSGAIHIVNYYRDACLEDGCYGAPEEAVQHGWVPCTLAALTTAVGLGSLYVSDITPIRKFGTFTAMGVVASLALLFTMLPACLYRFAPRFTLDKNKPKNHDDMHPWMRRAAQFIVRRNGWVCAGWLIVMGTFGVGLTRIETTVQLLKLFSSDADIIGDYRWLETHLGNLVPMEVVLQVEPAVRRRGDEDPEADGRHYRMNLLERLELTERVQQHIERLDEVGRTLSVATFAPAVRSSGPQISAIGQRFALNRSLEDHYKTELLGSDYLREETEPMPIDGPPDPPDGRRQLWRISARLAALADVDYGAFVSDLKHAVEPILDTYRARDQILSQLHAAGKTLRRSRICIMYTKADDRSRGDTVLLLRQLLREAGARVRAIDLAALPRDTQGQPALPPSFQQALARQDCLVFTEQEDQLAHQLPLPEGVLTVQLDAPTPAGEPPRTELVARYTGIVPLVYKTQRQLLISLRESIVWAFGLIAVIMMFVLRSPAAGLVAMVPNIFPIILVFGAMGWLRVKIDIGIMMTASVALGVAVDDTVHFLFWFRRGMQEGRDRKAATMLAYERCARAMFQTTVIGGLGLFVFAFSTFTPTQQFGILMVALLSAALVGDLFLLPAILAGPVGKFFCGRLVRDVAASSGSGEPDEPETPPPHGSRGSAVRRDTQHRSLRT